MLIAGEVHISTVLSLIVMIAVLTLAIGALMVKNKRTTRAV
ncbi:MAG: hypothetical protein ACOYN6_14955 [Ignavibacteria bacterium]